MNKVRTYVFLAGAVGIVSLIGVFASSRQALAQNPNQGSAPVTIVSPLPLPVTVGTEPLVLRRIDEPGRIPYQVTVRGPLPVLPAVPAGHRLVIQSVSARFFTTGTALGMLKIGVAGSKEFTLPMTMVGTEPPLGNLWVAHESVTIYVDPGTAVQFVPEAPFQNPSIQATVSGYLLECSTALPCNPIAP